MSWTDDRVALLKKLWGEGRTAAEIAKILGAGFTRNAVIGKAHRLKLSSRVSPVPAIVRPKVVEVANQSRRTAPVVVANTVAAAPRVKPLTRSMASAPIPPVVTKGIKMIDLKERMCRWPLGDPKDADFKFCGCNNVAGLPYCEAHARMAYQVNKRSRLFSPEETVFEDVDDDLIKSVIA